MKGICFSCTAPRCVRGNPQNVKERQNANRTSRTIFPARKFRQGVSLAVGEHARAVVRESAMGPPWFRFAKRHQGERHHLRGSEACVRPPSSRENGQRLPNRSSNGE